MKNLSAIPLTILWQDSKDMWHCIVLIYDLSGKQQTPQERDRYIPSRMWLGIHAPQATLREKNLDNKEAYPTQQTKQACKQDDLHSMIDRGMTHKSRNYLNDVVQYPGVSLQSSGEETAAY